MSKVKTLINMLISDRRKLKDTAALYLSKFRLARAIPDKLYLQVEYWLYFGALIDWDNPRSFNEKLQFLKIYNRDPLYTRLVDKVAVKKYVADIIGPEHVVRTLGVWDRVEDIGWRSLPDKFVIKTSHDSQSTFVCSDSSVFDIDSVARSLSSKLENNLFWFGREWPYRNVAPKIMAEELLSSSDGEDLRDYKFFCFDGVVKCFKVDYDRFSCHGANYYLPNGALLPFGEVVCPPNPEREVCLPGSITKMIEYAEALSSGMPFVRVDFYDVEGFVYFGEMTFFPASGFGRFTSEEWDKRLGDWINLDLIDSSCKEIGVCDE